LYGINFFPCRMGMERDQVCLMLAADYKDFHPRPRFSTFVLSNNLVVAACLLEQRRQTSFMLGYSGCHTVVYNGEGIVAV
jgi:hypothetical protein